MTTSPRTPSERTEALLQRSAALGSPVLIPGARERRTTPPIDLARPQVVERAQTAAISERERLERALEGGGALTARRAGARPTLFAKLWQTFVHPADLRIIWRRPVPDAAH